MQEEVRLSSQEYQKRFLPKPGYVLIEKDIAGEGSGGVILTRQTRDRSTQAGETGVIVAVSPWPSHEPHVNTLADIYKLGDRVGFSATTPIGSPIPPFYRIENPDREKDRSVVIHIEDILGHVADSSDEVAELVKRND